MLSLNLGASCAGLPLPGSCARMKVRTLANTASRIHASHLDVFSRTCQPFDGDRVERSRPRRTERAGRSSPCDGVHRTQGGIPGRDSIVRITVCPCPTRVARFRKAIQVLSGADADKPQKMFGSRAPCGAASGSLLGQSIVYARISAAVPPWTEEQQQQRKQAEKPKS